MAEGGTDHRRSYRLSEVEIVASAASYEVDSSAERSELRIRARSSRLGDLL